MAAILTISATLSLWVISATSAFPVDNLGKFAGIFGIYGNLGIPGNLSKFGTHGNIGREDRKYR